MEPIKYKAGLQLWVWDTGELEGFTVYLNGGILDDQETLGMRYDIDPPAGTSAIVVQFGGADGGATKIVDTTTNETIAHQDSGTNHGYLVNG